MMQLVLSRRCIILMRNLNEDLRLPAVKVILFNQLLRWSQIARSTLEIYHIRRIILLWDRVCSALSSFKSTGKCMNCSWFTLNLPITTVFVSVCWEQIKRFSRHTFVGLHENKGFKHEVSIVAHLRHLPDSWQAKRKLPMKNSKKCRTANKFSSSDWRKPRWRHSETVD